MRFRSGALFFVSILAVRAGTAQEDAATARRLIDASMNAGDRLARLEHLCYGIGNRMTGSKALEDAVAWSANEMKKAGLENVRTIPVRVPHWIRGQESATMLAPFHRKLFMVGLGGSAGTPKDGITADVVAVSTFDELDKLGRAGIQGRIVLFDAPFTTYGATAPYRTRGAGRAAALGAVAVLVRSVTPRSLRDPHTGAVAPAAIPAAAVSVEDAIWMHRLRQNGQTVRVRLEMDDHAEPDAQSANVMGEIRGSEKPDEVIVIGGHLDSWDVGQGAHDDGGGVMAALEAAVLIKELGLKPKRTIRVVFWTSEENSGNGGKAYFEWARNLPGRHIAAIEMDGGAERPVGFEFAGGKLDASPIAKLLLGMGAGELIAGEPEADVSSLAEAGVPVFGLRTTMEHYWDYHHTEADTFDKIVPADFRRCVAAFAVMSFGLAQQ